MDRYRILALAGLCALAALCVGAVWLALSLLLALHEYVPNLR